MAEYLAIKNWKKFQPTIKEASAGWIKDYADKDADDKYSQLTMIQRYMMDACCRLRARFGRNLTNDMLWICRATAVIPRERHNATAAIQELIRRGFLLPTNQRDSTPREDKRREEEIREETPSPKPTAQGEIFLKAYESYPKHEAKIDAEKAWGKAVNKESAKRVAPLSEHEDFLYQKVMHYGAVMRKKLAKHEIEKQFIPLMATWLNKGRYLDDPSEWEVTRQEQRNGNETTKAEQRNADISETTQRVFGEALGVLGNAPKSLPLKTPT